MALDPIFDMGKDEPDNDTEVMPGVGLEYFEDMPFAGSGGGHNPGSHGKKKGYDY